MRNQDTYKEPKIFNFSGMIVKVHIPELTIEERKKRMDIVKSAAENLLKKS